MIRGIVKSHEKKVKKFATKQISANGPNITMTLFPIFPRNTVPIQLQSNDDPSLRREE